MTTIPLKGTGLMCRRVREQEDGLQASAEWVSVPEGRPEMDSERSIPATRRPINRSDASHIQPASCKQCREVEANPCSQPCYNHGICADSYGPAPFAGFVLYRYKRRYAREIQQYEYHEGDGRRKGDIMRQSRLQGCFRALFNRDCPVP